MAEILSPLEEAPDEIADVFYEKKNRDLLDFVNKCWRSQESRKSAKELLKHSFVFDFI